MRTISLLSFVNPTPECFPPHRSEDRSLVIRRLLLPNSVVWSGENQFPRHGRARSVPDTEVLLVETVGMVSERKDRCYVSSRDHEQTTTVSFSG